MVSKVYDILPVEHNRLQLPGSTNFAVGISLLLAIPLSGIMLEKLGAQALACFYLAIILLAGASFYTARALLIGKWLVFFTKM